MLNLVLSIDNLWHRNIFKNIFNTGGLVSKNKAWEFQIYENSETILNLRFSLSFRNRDHAGLEIEIGIFEYNANFSIYDTRHWDHENDCWQVYEN